MKKILVPTEMIKYIKMFKIVKKINQIKKKMLIINKLEKINYDILL